MDNAGEDKRFGRYEKRLCLLLLLSAVPNAFSDLQFLVTHYTPPFRCAFKAYTNITREPLPQRHLSIPLNESLKSCWIQNNVTTNQEKKETSSMQPCTSFIFEENVETAATQFAMVCDKAWWKPTIISMYMIGIVVGSSVAGIIADRFGRRIAFLLFFAGQFVFSISTSFTSSFITYGMCVGISGLFGLANFEMATIIGMETVSVEKRGLVFFYTVLGFGLGYVLIALCSFLFTSWRWFLVFGGLMGIPYIPYYWLIDETPTWLMAKGRIDEAKHILRKIEKYNGFTENCRPIVKPIDSLTSNSSSWTTCKQFVQEKRLLGRLVIVALSWFIVSMTYYVTTLNNNSLSGNRHLNIFYASIAEILSSLVYYFGNSYFGRRKSFMSCMFMTSITLCAAPFLAKWNGTASMVANMFAKFAAGVAFNVLYPYNSELFPTTIRSSVFGLCNASARIGSIIAPFVIYVGESGNTLAPSIGMAVVLFVSALFYLLIPETKNTRLPQTVKEAKNLNCQSPI